jgi:exodeoxyribonuclease VII small subunit
MAKAKAAKSAARTTDGPDPQNETGEPEDGAHLTYEGSELRFEDALTRLEGVVDRLEEGELDLEASLAAFEEGVRLSGRCARQLDAAEQRVEVLVREAGSLTKRLFDTGNELEGGVSEQDEPEEER